MEREIDKIAIIANFISVFVYYIYLIYSYDKDEYREMPSPVVLFKIIIVPLLLLAVGSIPFIFVSFYLAFVVIVGIVNKIRGRSFFEDIDTFGFFNKE